MHAAHAAADDTAAIKQTATPYNPAQLRGQDGLKRWVVESFVLQLVSHIDVSVTGSLQIAGRGDASYRRLNDAEWVCM